MARQVVTALKSDELEEWFDHVHTVFGTPREYFMRHYFNDPFKRDDDIWVVKGAVGGAAGGEEAHDGARDVERTEIASTVRIFWRSIHVRSRVRVVQGCWALL